LRKSIQSLVDYRRLSMHELVHHTFHSKLLSALRRPSFAGTGLPERMRSVSFALLGLTAAAGLALVAIFAHPGFPVLSPAPLPAEPSASESIAGAESLTLGRTPVAVLPARPAHLQPRPARAAVKAPTEDPSSSVAGSDESHRVAPAAVDVPAPVSAPGPSGGSSGNSGGGSGAGATAGGGSDPAPTATPAQPAAPPSAPPSSPHPTNPKPEAIASAPKPEPAPAPGNSSSAAAAEHASERGIEASAGAGPPANTAASAPEAAAPPGNGNGLAKGHDK
jgi:hypothetical protein